MPAGKGTIQDSNGIMAVDKKHLMVVEVQAFSEGQEHHTLKPILNGISARYKNTETDEDILNKDIIVTANTGFSNEC
ncbi:hypothetical protein [Microbulbifer sp. ZKSA002]|uniref:hypothetical protein n=1 Tax=Microbulbifer sp. ZKSA002 TaxID=3243388 RepID=UPI00403A04C3